MGDSLNFEAIWTDAAIEGFTTSAPQSPIATRWQSIAWNTVSAILSLFSRCG